MEHPSPAGEPEMKGPSAQSGADRERIAAHAPYVRALAAELVFDRELARDLSQDVLLAALENGPRETGSLRAWLAAVVRNLAAKALRSRARRADRESATARETRPVPTPAEILAREDRRRRLIEHVLALDEPVRSAMVLRFLEGLPPREVARRLGDPVETVRTRTKRGLAELRLRLDREHGGRRDAWCFALVAALKVEPPSLAAVAAGTLGALLPGAVAVGTASKLSISALSVVALAAAVMWIRDRGEPAFPDTEAVAAAPDPTPTVPAAEREPVARTEGRDLVAPATPPSIPISAESTAPATGSLKIEFRWHDGTPAAGVGARLHSLGLGDYYADAVLVRSDESGECVLEELPPGRMSIHGDRGTSATCEIVAGERTRVEFALPRGFDVSGRVVDDRGEPVAGAELMLDLNASGWNGHVVGWSGADGRFTVRAVDAGFAQLSARAPLHAPSPQRLLIVTASALEGVEFTLSREGGALEGVVLGGDGSPLAGARVLAGEEGSLDEVRFADGGLGREPAAQLVTCDELGRFAIRGVRAGRVPLQARARGHAPWSGEVEAVAGRTSRIEIRLGPGTTVAGVVRDDSGAPIERAEILGNRRYAFASGYVRSAKDGSFVLSGLPSGRFVIEAESRGLAKVVTELSGSPGARVEWNPVLRRGPPIVGRLVAAGLDFSEWNVQAFSERLDVQSFLSARVSADGSFELRGAADVPYRLEVNTPGTYETVAMRPGVRPGDPPLEIEIDPDWVPSCTLRGRFVDDAGRPAAGLAFSVLREGAQGATIRSADAEGRFEIGPAPGGRYSVFIRTADFAPYRGEWVEAASGTVLDFGDVRLERGGTIAVALDRRAEIADEHVYVDADGAGTSELLPVHGGVARSVALAPGEYRVRLYGSRPDSPVAPCRTTVTVRADEETRIELPLEIGREVSIEVVPARAHPPVVTVLDAAGRTIWEIVLVDAKPVRLPIGAARISVPREGGPWCGDVADLFATQGERWTIDLGRR